MDSEKWEGLRMFGAGPWVREMTDLRALAIFAKEPSCRLKPTIGWNPWPTYTLDPRALPAGR